MVKPKKYYVYVKDPSTGNVKKVSWGDTSGLKVKLNDPAARKSFAARHKCDQQNDKTKFSHTGRVDYLDMQNN